MGNTQSNTFVDTEQLSKPVTPNNACYHHVVHYRSKQERKEYLLMLPPWECENDKDNSNSIIRYDIQQDSYSKLTEYPAIAKPKETTKDVFVPVIDKNNEKLYLFYARNLDSNCDDDVWWTHYTKCVLDLKSGKWLNKKDAFLVESDPSDEFYLASDPPQFHVINHEAHTICFNGARHWVFNFRENKLILLRKGEQQLDQRHYVNYLDSAKSHIAPSVYHDHSGKIYVFAFEHCSQKILCE